MTRLISTTRPPLSWPPTFGVAPPWVLKLNYKIAGSRVGSHFSVAPPPPTSLATLPSLSLSLSLFFKQLKLLLLLRLHEKLLLRV